MAGGEGLIPYKVQVAKGTMPDDEPRPANYW